LSAYPAQSIVLEDIDWRNYRRLLKVFDGRPGIRLTYDRGTLEIMTTSPEHELLKRLLGRFIEALADELSIDIAGYGSMTFRRPRKRGLEADQCYWITYEAQMRGRSQIDLRTDPPPDLVVEIDITSSSLDRMAAYAVLGVAEVWRLDAQGLTFQLLRPDHTYAEGAASRAFPFLRPTDLAGFLAQRTQISETALLREFRTWVRQRTAGGSPPAP
jgi:Uma2 family endonuclease